MGRKKGEKRGFWGRKSSPGLGFSSSRKFLWGLASMRREPGGLPMWQECREARSREIIETEPESNKHLPLWIPGCCCCCCRLLAALPLAARLPGALPQPSQRNWRGWQAKLLLLLLKGKERKRRREERRGGAAGKGTAEWPSHPAPRPAQVVGGWKGKWGGGKWAKLLTPCPAGREGRRGEGQRASTMAGCVCGEEISYNSSTGEGSGLFWCPPLHLFFPIPHPT